MHNLLNLSGRRLMVTGASSGIGRACAVTFAKLGAELILVARSEDRLRETEQSIEGTGHQIVPFDLNRVDAIADLLAVAQVRERKCSGLVHSAGVCPVVPLAATSPKVVRDTMRLNFGAFVELCRQLTRRQAFAAEGGSLVAVSSVSARTGWAGGTAYCATKAALDSYVRVLALELAPRRIRANTICPGYTKTPMLQNTGEQSEESDADRESVQPLGFGDAEDIAHAAAFLLSDAARFVTGTNMVVDGGLMAKCH
jgi:NAD(P)-dependent dehydrogenase (short-subunit alcohol dehydrogenase family)